MGPGVGGSGRAAVGRALVGGGALWEGDVHMRCMGQHMQATALLAMHARAQGRRAPKRWIHRPHLAKGALAQPSDGEVAEERALQRGGHLHVFRGVPLPHTRRPTPPSSLARCTSLTEQRLSKRDGRRPWHRACTRTGRSWAGSSSSSSVRRLLLDGSLTACLPHARARMNAPLNAPRALPEGGVPASGICACGAVPRAQVEL